MPLNSKQKRHLRGLGHALDPVVHIGKNGLSDGLTRALDEALESHELVKLRVNPETPELRDDLATRLSEALRAEVAQTLGHTVLLYRKRAKDPEIKLP